MMTRVKNELDGRGQVCAFGQSKFLKGCGSAQKRKNAADMGTSFGQASSCFIYGII
jgi:hypothetical protein